MERKEKIVSKILEKNPNTTEIVIREGGAIEVGNLINVKINGNINAPSNFIINRCEDFKVNKTHCLVDRFNGVIDLRLNEQEPFGRYDIKGVITKGKKFSSLKINEEYGYEPIELSKRLKMLRSLFKSRAEHGLIVNSLKNIKAKLKQDLEVNDDNRGNINANFNQVLESNIPEKFTLELELIDGEPKKEIEVSVFIQGSNYNEIKCYLESIDAADIIEESTNEIINREIEILKNYSVIIEC